MRIRKIKLIFAVTIILFSTLAAAFSQSYAGDYSYVYFYPHELGPADLLQDGSSGPYLKITGKTLLVWVDLEPEKDFAHPTCYILISSDNTRIEKGKWQPVLNGKTILINEKQKYSLFSPYTLPAEISTDDAALAEFINIHVYPHELTLKDKLVDGLSGNQVQVYPNTLLIWVDLMPKARYVHPTLYVLISKHGTRLEKGEWWPILNGKQICYGEKNITGVISPFKVMRLLLESNALAEE